MGKPRMIGMIKQYPQNSKLDMRHRKGTPWKEKSALDSRRLKNRFGEKEGSDGG